MAMNPKYEFAGNALFDMHMEDNDLEAAAATMAILRKHVQSGYVLDLRGAACRAAKKSYVRERGVR